MFEEFKKQNSFNTLINGCFAGDKVAQAKIKEALDYVILGPKNGTKLTEAITSDQLFKLFVGATQGEFEKLYAAQEPTWTKIAQEKKLESFRPTQVRTIMPDFTDTMLGSNGGYATVDGALPNVPELTPYPTFGYKAEGRWIDTRKWGARVHMSWEALRNDDWGILQSFPADAAYLAARTVDAAVYGLLWSLDPTKPGFNTTNVNENNGTELKAAKADNAFIFNDVVKNAPLSLDSLSAAIKQVNETRIDGRPVVVPEFVLIVPPALEGIARFVTQSHQAEITKGNTKLLTNLAPPAKVEVVVTDIVDILGGATNGKTNWAIVPKGGKTQARTIIARTTLRGYETPEIRIKMDAGNHLGGGAVNPRDGSFDNDDIETRVRLITGAGLLHYDGIVCSTGQGK